MPESLTPGRNVGLVLREIDRYLAERQSDDQAADRTDVAAEETEEVRDVRRLLAGKSLVIVGGETRPQSRQALIDAFDLADCYWPTFREHTSNTRFETYIDRPDVAVVLLAIRWSSHSYGDLKATCDTLGKPMVRLKAGYGVNRVAVDILEQVSGRLDPEPTERASG